MFRSLNGEHLRGNGLLLDGKRTKFTLKPLFFKKIYMQKWRKKSAIIIFRSFFSSMAGVYIFLHTFFRIQYLNCVLHVLKHFNSRSYPPIIALNADGEREKAACIHMHKFSTTLMIHEHNSYLCSAWNNSLLRVFRSFARLTIIITQWRYAFCKYCYSLSLSTSVCVFAMLYFLPIAQYSTLRIHTTTGEGSSSSS